MEAEEPSAEPTSTLLERLRNMWQFANLAQYIHLFGDVLKIDKDFDIEVLEHECLRPEPSERLPAIGLALLKHVSSFKGLTPEIFNDYTRRQYLAKAPHLNPFGDEEEPKKFNDLDVFTRIRVLQQLSVWTLNNPNTIRERLFIDEREQTGWRIEPQGWDAQGRTLYVLDDNRLYRCTDAPPPPPPPPPTKTKAKPKKAKPRPRPTRSTRVSKRLKAANNESDGLITDEEEEEEVEEEEEKKEETPAEDDGLGGAKWECLCITLEDYRNYMNGIRKSKDPDEKDLYQSLQNDVIPVLEELEEERARQEARRAKEREVELKLATAKRSSRLAGKQEKMKQQEEEEEAERKRLADLAMAKAEQEKERLREEESISRRLTREQRIREREAKRILHEEELRKMKEDSEKLGDEASEGRMSERHLVKEMRRRQKELEELQRLKDEEWFFDCEVCGAGGDKYDDGTHSIECERCNVWQHSKCHGISEKRAASDDFHFVCKNCKRKEEEAKQPKLPPLKLRLNSNSPSANRTAVFNGTPSKNLGQNSEPVRIPPTQTSPIPTQIAQPLFSGPSLSPRGQALGPPGIERSEAAYGSPSKRPLDSPSPAAFRPVSAHQPSNGYAVSNGAIASSPPPHKPSSPFANRSFPLPNGNPWSTAQSLHHTPLGNSFNRPASSAGPATTYQSPIKNSPAPSPRPTNGIPNTYNFMNSPHSSFPPSSAQRPSFSPTKNSSPPPPAHMSSPAPAPLHIAPSPSQQPAQMLPAPIPAPEKHDGARPISSHNMSVTPVLPPIKALSPSAKPQNLSPPTKKQSPTPDRFRFTPVSGNGTQ
ncbi:hypothetical protein BU24DRAFT_418311 [Aaosphaeria arxii CBS 175.79]|uniref:PHD-type domain-containing protein n=1 Tax=Aaosphaeria arxii CBS 175.79 TaxID=1450172 RepID=A0A6A5XZX0_9PLEO|nr:uncharacterized protein BU24DRAFT_418311 [Aaosphaeria arxii CBS 175.79]KAF2018762.1 hypothetical protein BU24DRAFT_418311 [Aaosphaeria arxii CBS 175.79]